MAGSRSRNLGGVTAGVLFVLADIASAAEAESPRFVLDYVAPDTCPDRDAFLGAVRARTPRPQLAATDDDTATRIRVVIHSDASANESSGQLDLREPDGTAESRSVTSNTCGEVASALALVAAVMLDPDALAGPAPPLTTTARAAPPPVVPPPRSAPERVPPRPFVRPRTAWLVSGGAELGAVGGVGPAMAPAGGAFVGIERRGATLTSSARFSIDFARTSSDLRGGSQTYEWLGSTLRGCPAHLPLPRLAQARVAPCAALQVAGHRGTTSDVRQPTSSTQLWLAPVVSAVLEWELSSSVSLELSGGALFPLRRSRFFLAPNRTLFEVPAVSVTTNLGVRIRFL